MNWLDKVTFKNCVALTVGAMVVSWGAKYVIKNIANAFSTVKNEFDSGEKKAIESKNK